MNYLAHLLLAEPTPESRVGSLMPDMVRGRLPENLPAAVMQAVREHRIVDSTTDTYPAFIQLRKVLFTKWGRFAGPLADILLDHALSLQWDDYAPKPRTEFIAATYRDLSQAEQVIPPAMLKTVRTMQQNDWLNRYASPDGVRLTLVEFSYRLSRRFDRAVHLSPVVDELEALQDLLASTLAELFPALQQAVENSRS